jgi:hypothetical protein
MEEHRLRVFGNKVLRRTQIEGIWEQGVEKCKEQRNGENCTMTSVKISIHNLIS